MAKPVAGLRKRQQINRANQMMFVWIAGVSIIVGFSIVLIIFLAQRIWFGEKVIAEKLNTISVLEKNLNAVPELKDNVRLLNTDENLKATRLNDSDPALQSVLDALPAEANSTAMASSLQTKLLSGVTGVIIESLKVEPVSGIEIDVDGGGTSSNNSIANAINFSFAVSSASNNQTALREVLVRMEKSIRPFTIKTLAVESQGTRVVMTATGHGYYEPQRKIELIDKVVRP